MQNNVSHAVIVSFFRYIANAHVNIKGFYRFNWDEIQNAIRSGIESPTLLLESHDSEVRMPNKVASFNARTISWMILDFAPNDNFEKQEQVLDETETIALEVMSYFKKCREDHAHWLYGKYEGDFEMQKVGPIFDNRFGWNVIIQIKNQQKMCFEAEKWNFPTESV